MTLVAHSRGICFTIFSIFLNRTYILGTEAISSKNNNETNSLKVTMYRVDTANDFLAKCDNQKEPSLILLQSYIKIVDTSAHKSKSQTTFLTTTASKILYLCEYKTQLYKQSVESVAFDKSIFQIYTTSVYWRSGSHYETGSLKIMRSFNEKGSCAFALKSTKTVMNQESAPNKINTFNKRCIQVFISSAISIIKLTLCRIFSLFCCAKKL